jgi:deoxycytidine triphosphate deaminase
MAFACTSLTEITIPDSVELIDELAFAFNSDLRSVHIGRGVKRIMPGAFSGCTRLDKITIDCENDNYYVHSGCLIEKNNQKLVLIAAPYVVANDVKIIEKQTFVSLVYCESITIPESVEHICMDGDSLANFSMCVYTEYEGETEWSTRPFVIRASHGSYAERFAREHNFCFEEI